MQLENEVANQNASDQAGESSKEQPLPQQTGGSGRQDNTFSVGPHSSSAETNANQSESDQQKNRQRHQGPRPTSDNRAVDPSNLQKPMQKVHLKLLRGITYSFEIGLKLLYFQFNYSLAK